jgi:hypothetical protein
MYILYIVEIEQGERANNTGGANSYDDTIEQ